jgi:hypothetical protein
MNALATQSLRVSYLRSELSAMPIHQAAQALQTVCLRAQQSSPPARVLLVAFTGMLHDAASAKLIVDLRLEVEPDLQSPLRDMLWIDPNRGLGDGEACDNCDDVPRVPDYGKGRVLTLGERKALARKPSRKMFDKLLLDPDPSVIHNLLTNPLTTEDDVVRLAARRPLRVEVIEAIMRHNRWNIRRRVRLALVLNPYTPARIGVPLVGLLLRPELRMTVDGPETSEQVRLAARTRLRQMKAASGSG